LNGLRLPGVYFHPYYYTPTFSKFQKQLCEGVQLHILDEKKYDSVRTGLELLHVIASMHEREFQWLLPQVSKPLSGEPAPKPFIDLLSGSDLVRKHIFDRSQLDRILDVWEREAADFRMKSKNYWLYEEG